MEDIIILGSGPAGCTAAIYGARAGYVPLVLAGPLPGGLLTQTPKIENYPGYPDPVSGFELTDAMMRQAERLGAKFQFHTVKKLELREKVKRVTLEDGGILEGRAVILALGVRHRQLAGKGRFQGKAVSYCATCDGAFYRGQVVALAGNGSAALNEALFLSGMAATLHLLVPGPELKGPQVLRERIKGLPNVLCHFQTRVTDVREASDGRLAGVQVTDMVTGKAQEVPCRALFLALGFDPDTQLLEGTGITLDEGGYIKLDDHGRSLTGIPGVFAAGDCVDPRYKQAVVAAGSGAKAAMDAAEYLRSLSSLNP